MSVQQRVKWAWVRFGRTTLGSAEPHLSPTQGQLPRTGSYRPQEAIPAVRLEDGASKGLAEPNVFGRTDISTASAPLQLQVPPHSLGAINRVVQGRSKRHK